jgi:hypothetical protein
LVGRSPGPMFNEPRAFARASRAVVAERECAMPSGYDRDPDAGAAEPTWRSTLRAASIFVLVTVSVAVAFFGLK